MMDRRITFSSLWYDHQFEEQIASKLRKRFPGVVFDHVQDSTGYSETAWKTWEDSDQLDIRLNGRMMRKSSVVDLSPFLADSSVNLDLFAPGLLVDVTDEEGRIYGLPLEIGSPHVHALMYNADVFDKFGVPYPEDGMTWDEVITLARKVTGEIDGIQYCGFDIGEPNLLKVQLGMTYLDPMTHEPRLREEDVQEYFRIIKEAYSIPGNLQETNDRLFVYGKAFRKQGNVAMCIHSPVMFSSVEIPFKLGAVTFPKTNDSLIVPSLGGPVHLYLHHGTKNPELAFEVTAYMVSEEFQLEWAREGRISSLSGKRYEEEFACDVPAFSEKSMAWIFKGEKRGWPEPQSPHESSASIIVKEEMSRALRGKITWQDAVEAMEKRMQDEIGVTV